MATLYSVLIDSGETAPRRKIQLLNRHFDISAKKARAMPTRHGAPLYSIDVIGRDCFPLWAGLFGPACLSTGRVSREMGDGILGGKKITA